MEFIYTKDAPAPAGHYTQAVAFERLVFVSGQLPIHPETKKIPDSVKLQAVQAFSNMEAILKAAGSSMNNVLKTTVYIPDVSLWDEVNKVYVEFFGDHKPARTIVPSNKLHFGCLIEIDAIAIKKT